MIATGITAAALFFALWWLLHASGDDSPWLAAGLGAIVVVLVAGGARQVVLRRSGLRLASRYPEGRHWAGGEIRRTAKHGASAISFTLVQQQSSLAAASSDNSEAHLKSYHLCSAYLDVTREALKSGSVNTKPGLRSRREKVKQLRKHHLVTWARLSSREVARHAQQRFLLADKMEAGNRALEVLNAALEVYPDENELLESRAAIKEFMASAQVGHWIELAERAAFKGKHRRAMDRYQDALFYLSKADITEETRRNAAENIGRAMERLRLYIQSHSKRTEAVSSASDEGAQEKKER